MQFVSRGPLGSNATAFATKQWSLLALLMLSRRIACSRYLTAL